MIFPKYFEVDDVLVVVDSNKGVVTAKTVPGGSDYPPFKAAVAGREITKAEFDQLVKQINERT